MSDVRLPVIMPILAQLISVLPHVVTLHFTCIMLRAMMVLAFRAYLRVGQMVPRSSRVGQSCLHFRDGALNGDLITISFRRVKHSGKHGPQSFHVDGQCVEGT